MGPVLSADGRCLKRRERRGVPTIAGAEELANLPQRKPETHGVLYESNAPDSGFWVQPVAPGGSDWLRHDAEPFVVPQRVAADAALSLDLTNSKVDRSS